MTSIEDIPFLPDRDERIDEVTVDTNGQDEQLSAFEVYFTDAMHFPFEATWRKPEKAGHREPVTVLEVADVSERRGILLKVEGPAKKLRKLRADQVWANDENSPNATILNDYRYWFGMYDPASDYYE